jgi:DNA helicase-2/ATP-dependent DNA helicase PcrA
VTGARRLEEAALPPSHREASSHPYRKGGSCEITGWAIMKATALDPAQQSAAAGTGNIQLVLAGPGAGKTTTLAGRFVHLVRHGIDRRRILALTFTKKAADEMKSRIAAALDLPSAADLNVATFHGFAFRQLRRNPPLAGLSERFPLWDTPQQRHVFSSRRMWWNEEDDILDIISGAKERLLDAAGFAAEIDPNDEVLCRAVEFFRVYEGALREAGAIDFADMVPLVVRSMERNHAYAAAITGAYDHMLVDEYQDINPGQVGLIDRFVTAGANLWAVGDDDQTLYAFRAADVRFILDFPRKYRDVQVHLIDRNYRSATQIVEAANRLIAHNRMRRPKAGNPVVAEAGEIVIRGYRTAEIEARQVAKGIASLLKRGQSPQRIAVLYRTGAVGLAFQPALQALQIPYEVRGAGDLWQSVAARLVVGALFYLRDGESAEAMSRIGSGWRGEIVRRDLDRASAHERGDFAAASRFVRAVVATAVPSRASDRERAEWVAVVEAVIALALGCRSLDELLTKIAEQSGALRNSSENAVVLSTIHSAKGLEWEAVFLTGMEQGVLPHINNDDMEEERRVAYVGVTRAKRLLGMTFAKMRFGQTSSPSQFLYELAGEEKRGYIWTNPEEGGADERLPLLSNRERQRVIEGLLQAQPAVQSPKAASSPHPSLPRSQGREGWGLSRHRRTAPPDQQQAQMNRNNAAGAPPRHGLSWSADEDDRLRAAFQAGDPIAVIASAHERKIGAITARLVRLGLISEDGVVVDAPSLPSPTPRQAGEG